MTSGEHHHYFQMIQGGMGCACGETIRADKSDLPGFLRAADEAMQAEGVPAPLRQRVLNRLVYGDPRGFVARETIIPAASAGHQVVIHVTTPDGPGAQGIRDEYIRQARRQPRRW